MNQLSKLSTQLIRTLCLSITVISRFIKHKFHGNGIATNDALVHLTISCCSDVYILDGLLGYLQDAVQ
jgi:hypothetical protein